MRRSERQITDMEQVYQILDECRVCRVAMLDESQPYIVPLNFGYEKIQAGFTVYMHGATEGRKAEVLRKNPQVCFEMDVEYGLYAGETACAHSYGYASIIGWGKVQPLQSAEDKIKGLKAIMRHLTGHDDFTFPPQALNATMVLALEVESFTAKRNRR